MDLPSAPNPIPRRSKLRGKERKAKVTQNSIWVEGQTASQEAERADGETVISQIDYKVDQEANDAARHSANNT